MNGAEAAGVAPGPLSHTPSPVQPPRHAGCPVPPRASAQVPPPHPGILCPHTRAQSPPAHFFQVSAQMNFIKEALLEPPVAAAPRSPPEHCAFPHLCTFTLLFRCSSRGTRPALTATPSAPKLGAWHTDDAQSETERDRHPELLGPVRAHGPALPPWPGLQGRLCGGQALYISAPRAPAQGGLSPSGDRPEPSNVQSPCHSQPLRVKALGSLLHPAPHAPDFWVAVTTPAP